MAVERYGSKTDVVVKLILVFFISLLSFSIGTFVGKKFSDNQHKIAQLEPQGHEKEVEEADRDPASVNPEAGEVKPKDALNDEEIKKLAEEFVSDDEGKKAGGEHSTGEKKGGHEGSEDKSHASAEKPEENHATAEKAEEVHGKVEEHHTAAEKTEEHHAATAKVDEESHHATAEIIHKPSEAASRVVAGHPIETESDKEASASHSRIPQSLPKELATSAIGKFTVQVASYADEGEAQKLSSSLKEKGFSAFYVSAHVKDKKTAEEKTWFRVSVGLFTTQKEAEAYKKDLLARAKVGSAIVQKVSN